MDRCALFVDAGYVLTDGAMAVHGTRRRESVTWDYAGLLQLLGNLATERTRLPLLRCYWYEATVEGRRSAEHDALADLPGVKVRVSKMRPGRREGVEGEIHRDLTTLARNKAVSDVMVVSADEDLTQVIADVQDTGMRVTLLYMAGDGSRTIARPLLQECDDTMEISTTQLRTYVELITGAEPPRAGETGIGQFEPRPAVNGKHSGNGSDASGGAHALAAPLPAGYAQPQGMPEAGPPRAEPPARQVPQPAAMEGPQADPGQPDHADAPMAPAGTDYASVADFGAGLDYAPATEYASPGDQGPAAEQASAVDYTSALDYGPVPDYATSAPAQPREDIYAAPVALPVPSDDLPGDRDRLAGGPRGDLAAYNPGSVRQPYQREGMLRESAGDAGDRLHPVPAVPPGAGPPAGGPGQVRRLPTRGAVPGGPGQGQPQPGLPPAPPDAGGGQQLGGQQLAGQQPVTQPSGAQPTAPIAPVVPMDPNGMGYLGAPGAPPHMIPGPNPNPGPPQVVGPPGAGSQVPSSAPQVQQFPQQPPIPVGQQVPGAPQETGGQTGPIGLVGPGGHPGDAPGGAPGASLADAVQSAHEEGQAFGESVARDAPALWLEAVLARKPRMPSDLEARLLQGSALPIDFLLHDEVRHALRRGFWDALERARR